jgi:hypothetical protein
VLANVSDAPLPTAMLSDYARVTKKGGQLVVASPLRGTWLEFLDIFREVLVQAGRNDALGALDAYVSSLPEADSVAEMLEDAGPARGGDRDRTLGAGLPQRPRVLLRARDRARSAAPSGRRSWGREVLHETFLAIKDSIDTYFAGPRLRGERVRRALLGPQASLGSPCLAGRPRNTRR